MFHPPIWYYDLLLLFCSPVWRFLAACMIHVFMEPGTASCQLWAVMKIFFWSTSFLKRYHQNLYILFCYLRTCLHISIVFWSCNERVYFIHVFVFVINCCIILSGCKHKICLVWTDDWSVCFSSLAVLYCSSGLAVLMSQYMALLVVLDHLLGLKKAAWFLFYLRA